MDRNVNYQEEDQHQKWQPYHEPHVKADMKIIESIPELGKPFAVGSVTIDGYFTINNVSYKPIKDKQSGEAKMTVLLPKKKCSDGHWEPVFKVSNQLYHDIFDAVADDIKKHDLRRDVFDPDKLDISVNVCVKGDFLGYATMTYDNIMTVNDIRIFKADNEYGIRLALPYSYENGKTTSLMETSDFSSNENLIKEISKAYMNAVQNQTQDFEQTRGAR